MHMVGILIPSVEVADYGDAQGVRRPYAEHRTGAAVHPVIVRAEELIGSDSVAAVEQIQRESLIV